MKLIYTPADGDQQEFIFRPAELFSFEAEKIEEVGGPSWSTLDEFGDLFMRGNRKAWRAALWIMLKRGNPTLRFPDLVVQVREIEVELEDDEMASTRELVEASEDMSDQEKADALELIDQEKLRREVEESGKVGDLSDIATDLE